MRGISNAATAAIAVTIVAAAAATVVAVAVAVAGVRPYSRICQQGEQNSRRTYHTAKVILPLQVSLAPLCLPRLGQARPCMGHRSRGTADNASQAQHELSRTR